jgi:hypothetical protein
MKKRLGRKEPRKSVAAAFARVVVAATFVVGAACTDSTGPGGEVRIEPAAPTITLQSTPQGQILNTTVTLTNSTEHPVAFSSCGISLERPGMPALPPGKSEWETVWARICYLLEVNPAALSSVFPDYTSEVLQPGQSITIPVYAVVGQAPYTNFTGAPGTYRFHISLSTQILGRYYPLPYESSVSDSFTLLPAS